MGLEGGVTAELGGGLGGDDVFAQISAMGCGKFRPWDKYMESLHLLSISTFAKAGVPRESLLKRLVARSVLASDAYDEGGCVSRVAIVALARRACAENDGSFSISSSYEIGVSYRRHESDR